MKSSVLSAALGGALLLASSSMAQDEASNSTLSEARLGSSVNPFNWVVKFWKGARYTCKCAPGDWCWPNSFQWQSLNRTVGGNLRVNIPIGAPCYNTFQGPLGNINTYDAAQCANVTANFGDEQFQIDHPTASLWSYFTNDTCRPTANPSDTCTLGYYPVLYIDAKTTGHIQAGINFARQNNVRLIIRNTGHDFLGRSVGWGALVINTHSFQALTLHNTWNGPGGYSGSAITVGAGVQAKTALAQLHAHNPPKVMVTGECATVGVAGGLPQGGGHGPWTNFKGFLADTALQFKVITADGVLRTANANQNSNLFWALRGGGPSTFGVIVEASYKTFDDVPSSGIHFDIINVEPTLFWEAFRVFHSYAEHFVDNGLYVYYEQVGAILRIHPILGIGKTVAELQAIVQPLFDDLDALGVLYTPTTHFYPTFYELFQAEFEVETAGQSALTGGWTIARQDQQNNHTAIVEAFKTIINAGAIVVGHMWNGGHGLPSSEWSKSAINPRFRNVVDKLITVIPLAGNAPLADKAAAQHTLTYVVDGSIRAASPNGAAYINEADPFQPNWQTAFWGINYPALAQARKKWDPNGVFYAVSTPGTEKWVQIEDSTRLCKVL